MTPKHPIGDKPASEMTVRERMAMAALQGILSNPTWNAAGLATHGIDEMQAMKVAGSMAVMYASLLIGALNREAP